MIGLIWRLMTAAARRSPRRWLEASLNIFLHAAFFLHPARRRRLRANYRRILEHSGKRPADAEIARILRATVPLYAKLLITTWARPDDVEFARDKVELEFWPLMQEAFGRGHGVILVLSYFGLLGHTAMALLLRGVPVTFPVLDRRSFACWPNGWDKRFVDVGTSAQRALQALARNEAVFIAPMVNFMARREPVPFFGAPAALNSAPQRLAALSQAPLLPAFTLYENGRCRAVSDGLIWPEGPRSAGKIGALLTRVQEKYIARYPEHWHVYDDVWDLKRMDLNYRVARAALRWL